MDKRTCLQQKYTDRKQTNRYLHSPECSNTQQVRK